MTDKLPEIAREVDGRCCAPVRGAANAPATSAELSARGLGPWRAPEAGAGWEPRAVHIGCTPHRAHCTSAPGQRYPSGFGLDTVSKPRGVVITGDLTDGDRTEQAADSDAMWGVNGERETRFAVFEGWGNHDDHSGREAARDMMGARAARRMHPTRPD